MNARADFPAEEPRQKRSISTPLAGAGTIRQPRVRDASEARRRHAMAMLESGVSQAEVSRKFAVSRQTVSVWNRALAGDPQAWRGRPLGRPPALSADDKDLLTAMLESGGLACGFERDAWTLVRVGALIAREFGPAYSKVHVLRILRQLGFAYSGRKYHRGGQLGARSPTVDMSDKCHRSTMNGVQLR